MPGLEAYFHYRNLDVRHIEELARRWRSRCSTASARIGAYRTERRARFDRGTRITGVISPRSRASGRVEWPPRRRRGRGAGSPCSCSPAPAPTSRPSRSAPCSAKPGPPGRMPHNQINAIVQTPDGYLWFATWEGLVRYNGLEFQVFDRRNVPELRDNGIRSLRVSADGALVMGTSRGGGDHPRPRTLADLRSPRGLTQDEVMDAALTAAAGCGPPRTQACSCWMAPRSPVIARAGLPSDIVYGLLPARDGRWGRHRGRDRAVLRQPTARILAGPASACPPRPCSASRKCRMAASHAGDRGGCVPPRGSWFVPLSPLLPRDGVASFARDHAGALWIGTVSSGLLRLDRDGLERFDSRQGCRTTASRRCSSIAKAASGQAPTAGCCARCAFTTHGSANRGSATITSGPIPPAGRHVDRHQPRPQPLAERVLVRSFTRADGLFPAIRSRACWRIPTVPWVARTRPASCRYAAAGSFSTRFSPRADRQTRVRALLRTGPDTLIGTSRGLVRPAGRCDGTSASRTDSARLRDGAHQARNGDVWVAPPTRVRIRRPCATDPGGRGDGRHATSSVSGRRGWTVGWPATAACCATGMAASPCWGCARGCRRHHFPGCR